ncbi:MAG: type II toxin-antitoxin system MqsA family antitoxin [Verrucomicrobia bacterium]|nr:type II toxin-antitoxin system MqsA family antitoxin [Verrucomicrobiota bacterium]
MKCVICKDGNTEKGFTSVTLERNGMLFVVKQVPAHICTNCGEAYIDEKITSAILEMAQRAFFGGVQLEICSYKAA